jgi:predicted negative regulator of RcsB-dependent stress response
VESYRTEEEQVEALRKWWDENGRSTLAAVALALGVGFGWQQWQTYSLEQQQDASARYDAMLEAAQLAEDDAGVATLRHLATEIKTDYPGSSYAVFAAMHLARLAIEDGELDSAEAELRWVLTKNPAEEIRPVAELRLARVMAAQGDAAGALKIIESSDAGSYAPAYAETRGDILLAMGEPGRASDAYQEAVALTAASGSGASESLQLKLAALNPVTARSATADIEE